ncbi:hypothetical protein [Gordonia sp. (in: high G+C Gram-positive bacteria)]|uniref:hypothetical protein n=1 Tax=Gordonia sp. (in: high G+C Gram-positive bacteria) TaxID=84139 RepID=UPI0039E35137
MRTTKLLTPLIALAATAGWMCLGAPSAQAAPVDPAPYLQTGAYYFTTPSGGWKCAISTKDGYAGCKGRLPADAPSVSGGGVASIHPNNAMVRRGSRATLGFTSDTSLSAPSPARVLGYGQVLSVGGYTCSVDAATGVSCDAGQHGFTVSTTGYRLR